MFTTLTKEALPVLRYRTRDLTSMTTEPCRCGRTLCRIGRIMGRTDDMLIIRGVNVYPSQIEHALLQVADVEPHYLLVVRRDSALDTLEVRVEAGAAVAEAGTDAMRGAGGRRAAEDLRDHRHHRRRQHRATKTVERSAGKAQRVLDLRN